MSTCSQATMTKHHDAGVFGTIGETFHVWRERIHQRRELTHWTERDMHDVGLSWTEISFEADKPFWRE